MGCFNSVCNLSGLPIYHGDKIKLIVTVPGREHRESSLVYPSDLRMPCFLPVTGEYDDYGCIENIAAGDPSHKLLDSYFKELKANKYLKFTDRYSKQYEESMYADCKWYKLIGTQAFKVGRFPQTVIKTKDDGIFLSYSMVLQEVWDQYLATYDGRGGYRSGVRKELNRWVEWFTKLQEHTKDNKWLTIRWGRDARYDPGLSDELKKLGNFRLDFMSEGMSHTFDSPWFTNLYFDNYLHPLFASNALKSEKGQKLWKWFEDTYVEFNIICRLMDTLPRFWMPSLYAGQERDYKLHKDIASITHKIAKRRYDKD